MNREKKDELVAGRSTEQLNEQFIKSVSLGTDQQTD